MCALSLANICARPRSTARFAGFRLEGNTLASMDGHAVDAESRLGVKRAELTAIHRRFAKVFLGSFEIDESVKLKRPPGRFSLSLSSFFQTVFPDTWKLAGYAEQGWSCRLFDYLPINHRCTPTKNSFGGTRNGRSNRFVAAGYFARRRSCRAADLPISP